MSNFYVFRKVTLLRGHPVNPEFCDTFIKSINFLFKISHFYIQ